MGGINIKVNFFIKSDIVKDSFLNIVASLILTITSQLIVYPYLARILSEITYGEVLTVMGIVNTIGISIGSSLNNTRLLLQKEDGNRRVISNYNILFVLSATVASLVIMVGINTFHIRPTDMISLIMLVFLLIFKSYYTVEFRLIINYKKILQNNLLGAMGYLLGILIFSFTKNWLHIFLIGELLSCLHLLFTATILKEPLVKDDRFKYVTIKYLYMLSAAIISNAMTYMDRFLLYPLLGSEYVAIYTVSSFLGKSIGILMIPISGVLLTYVAKEQTLSIVEYFKRLFLFTLLSLTIYIFTLLLGNTVTEILYPTIAERALPFLWIANLSAIVQVLSGIIQPMMMKYAHSKWYLTTQISYLILYLVTAYYSLQYGDLLHFCFAVLFSNLFKLFFTMIITVLSLKKISN